MPYSPFVSQSNGKTHCWCRCTISSPPYFSVCHSQPYHASKPKQRSSKNYKKRIHCYEVACRRWANRVHSQRPHLLRKTPPQPAPLPARHQAHINHGAPYSTNKKRVVPIRTRLTYKSPRIPVRWTMLFHFTFHRRRTSSTISTSLLRKHWTLAIWSIRRLVRCAH